MYCFIKRNVLSQCENRIQFLDYFWTLQELDLLENSEDNKDAFVLKSEIELNEFMDKYGQKSQKTTTLDETSEISISNNKSSELDVLTNESSKFAVSDEKVTSRTIYSDNKIKKSFKICKKCDQNLPIINFYKSSSYEDGYVEICKKCDDKSNAAKILVEIQKYIEIGKPFSQNELSKKIDNITKTKYYIWTLQEQDLIEYQEKTETYVLEKNKKFDHYIKFLNEENIVNTSENDSLTDVERSEHPIDVFNDMEIDNSDCKEIIYISRDCWIYSD